MLVVVGSLFDLRGRAGISLWAARGWDSVPPEFSEHCHNSRFCGLTLFKAQHGTVVCGLNPVRFLCWGPTPLWAHRIIPLWGLNPPPSPFTGAFLCFRSLNLGFEPPPAHSLERFFVPRPSIWDLSPLTPAPSLECSFVPGPSVWDLPVPPLPTWRPPAPGPALG